MLTTLTKEFFMPRFLERDGTERDDPIDAYPWDGTRGCSGQPPNLAVILDRVQVIRYIEHITGVRDSF